MTMLFAEERSEQTFLLRGLEFDNLLAVLALLGLLRALEERRPEWRPRASWKPFPWRVSLHLDTESSGDIDEAAVATAADEGVRAVIRRLAQHRPKDAQGNPLADVGFDPDGYRAYVHDVRPNREATEFAACLACAWPLKRDGNVPAGPLVMMFGQGHQHFLDRFFGVPLGGAAVGAIASALFGTWKRAAKANGFRWDPEDDQRYALRFGNPSKTGAAATEDGANRLATLGFLSLPTAPASRRASTRGVVRSAEVWFVWPIWRIPLSRAGIESLLSHPSLVAGRLHDLRPLGVDEIYRARRVSNGKFMNVTRACPQSD